MDVLNVIKSGILICLIFLLGFFYSDVVDASNFRKVKAVNSSSLIIRESPSENSNSIGVLKRSEFVIVYSNSDGWSLVEISGKKGFVQTEYLSNPTSTIKIANSRSGLVVKATPTQSSSTLAVLKYNMVVEDYGSVGGGWSFIQYGNVTGYVATSFMGVPKTNTKYVNTSSGVIVRNIASPSGASVGTLSNGTQVIVHSSLFGWSYVTSGKIKGYVIDKFLSTKKSNNSTSTQKTTVNYNLKIQELNNAIYETQLKRISYPTYSQEYRTLLEKEKKLHEEILNLMEQKKKELENIVNGN